MSDEKIETDKTTNETSSENLLDDGQNGRDESKQDDPDENGQNDNVENDQDKLPIDDNQSEPDENKEDDPDENGQNDNAENDIEESNNDDIELEEREDNDALVLEDINLPNDEIDDEDAGNGGKKKWVLIGTGAVLVAILAGVGMFYFQTRSQDGSNVNSSNAVLSLNIPKKSKLKKGRKKLLSSSKKLIQKNQSNLQPKPADNVKTSKVSVLMKKKPPPDRGKKLNDKKNKSIKKPASTDKNVISKTSKRAVEQSASGAKRLADGSLSLPSVTAAAYKGIPMMKNPKPLVEPDKLLGESMGGGVIPKISTDGRRPWKFYGKTFKNKNNLPRVSLIIKGLGLSRAATTAAINHTPSEVTLAFNPYAKNVGNWVSLARAVGHETLITLPMEPIDFPFSDPGPFALQVDLQQTENIDRLRYILSVSMGNIGLLQMMGTRFASSRKALEPILKEINNRGLLIIDNGLAKNSQIVKIASTIGLPRARSDAAIDRKPSRQDIMRALSKLESIAKKNKVAIGIARPLPNTISLIMTWTKTLASKNIILAPISASVKVTGKANLKTNPPTVSEKK